MHAAMRAGVLPAEGRAAGTRGALRRARGGGSSGSTRVAPRTLALRPVATRRVVSAAREATATAPGLGAGGRALPPRARRVRLSVARRAANDESKSSSNATADAADDDAASDAKEEVVGVEVPAPAGAEATPTGPPPSKLNDDSSSDASRKRDDKPAKTNGQNGGVGNFFAWLRAFFQPARLLGLFANGFLFLFAAQMFTQNSSGGGSGATHLVPVSYSRFMTAVKADDISKLTVDGAYLTWKPKQPFVIKRQGTGPLAMTEEKIEVAYSAARPEDASVPYELLHKNKVEFGAIDKRHQSQRNVNTFLTLFVVGLAMLQFNKLGAARRNGGKSNPGGGFMRGMGGGPSTSAGRMTGGKERGSLAPPSTTFADVAGVDEAKEELQEIVDILKRPEHYVRLGARPPSGVLLVGAPGTGKTLLARAVAGEAGVPFISVSASEFIELYVGMGAARVRDVFARAREQSPSIVFIDEIDAVAKGRSEGRMRGMGNDEREQTLNQLLTELDGFDGESLVICLAATNRADMLDSALKRPGRFDRTVSVERPDKQGRKEILGVHIGSRNLPLAPGFQVDDIATMTAGFSGAELANLVNEAALLAGRKGLNTVGEKEFEDAVLRTVAGIEKKRSLLTAAEKVVVSAHEAGHAVVGTAVGTLIPGTTRPEQLSIVARSGGALGFTYIPPGEEDRKLMFSDELRGRLVTLMGGRAAEIVSCSRVSTGALDDIQRATDLAYKAVAEYGLSASLGPMSVSTLSSGGNDDALFGGGVADGANRAVEKEVKDTLTSALWIAVGLVEKNLRCLEEIGDELSETEKVSGDWLQKKLDEVVTTADLERFLRGDTPQPPEGVKVWENLPLPAFPAEKKTNAR
jgi:cell division protease FtsH